MTTTVLPENTKIREVRIKTNLNGKLNCHYFCHIQIAGKTGITESVADNTVIKFITDDQSHLPVYARIIDSVRQPLGEISNVFTWLSHNMGKEDFIIKVLKEVKNTSNHTEMVIYFYQKED